MNEWLGMEDAPKGEQRKWGCGPRVLVLDERGVVYIARWGWHKNGGKGSWKTDAGFVCNPCGWMPLPEAKPL